MADGSFSDRARAAILNRGHGLCQLCFSRKVDQCHHRRPRKKGGTSLPLIGHPANGVGLCNACHSWVEGYRDCARDMGLLVRDGHDPREEPMYLLLPYGWGWYRVNDEGLVEFVHDGRPIPTCLPVMA